MSVQVHPNAEEELYQAAAWYEDRRPGLGVEFLTEVDSAVDVLRESPLLWALWPGAPKMQPPVRRALLRRFPFAIAYQVTTEHLLILAFAHTSRRPFYWANREGRESDAG